MGGISRQRCGQMAGRSCVCFIGKKQSGTGKRADEVIECIASAKKKYGYLDTYFLLKEPEHKWQNLQECHELYCAGHLMEDRRRLL